MKPSFLSSRALASLVLACLAAFSSCSREKAKETTASGETRAAGESPASAPKGDEKKTGSGEAAPSIPASAAGEDGGGEMADVPEDGQKPETAASAPEGASSKTGAGAVPRAKEGLLGSKTDDERIAEIRELAASGGESLGSALQSAMESESAAVREEAVRATAGLDSPGAVEILKTAAREGEPAEAAAAVEVARDLDNALRVSVLCESLASKDPETRRLAVLEFGEMRPKYDIQQIFPILNDTDPTVGTTAAETLDTLFGKRFSDASEANAWWGENAVNYDEKLVRTGP